MEGYDKLDVLLSILHDLPVILNRVIELNSKLLILEYEREQLTVEQSNLSTFICPLCKQASLSSFSKQLNEVNVKIQKIDNTIPLLKQSLLLETSKLEVITDAATTFTSKEES